MQDNFENLTQTGFDLELQRLNQQIFLFQEKLKKLSLSRARLYKLAGQLKLKIN